jgi:hypothetical protein
VDEEEDAIEADATPDDVLSLDEEFTRQALEAEALLSTPAPAAALEAAPSAAASLLRRPSMAHSVAVIVARGADF